MHGWLWRVHAYLGGNRAARKPSIEPPCGEDLNTRLKGGTNVSVSTWDFGEHISKREEGIRRANMGDYTFGWMEQTSVHGKR